MLGGGYRSQVQGEESLAWCHFWPTGCGVARADAKEPRKKKREKREPARGRRTTPAHQVLRMFQVEAGCFGQVPSAMVALC